jgi:hypothetical protein
LYRGVESGRRAHRHSAGDKPIDAELVGERKEVAAEVVPAVVVGNWRASCQPVGVPSRRVLAARREKFATT